MNQTGQELLRQRLVEVGRELYRRGYVSGLEGNISTLSPDGNVLITAAGSNLGKLDAEDIVEIDLGGNQISGSRQPSSESGMHLAVYSHRADVTACVHSHAPFATAYSVAGIQPQVDVLPEIVAQIGAIGLTEYASPGTPAIGESLQPYLSDCSAFLLKNHGLLTIGRSLEIAHQRHEIVESYLQILSIASGLGNIDKLPEQEILRLKKILADS